MHAVLTPACGTHRAGLPVLHAPQANQILGLAPGEIFVQRNVGNQAMHTDLNLMACLEYAVKSLKVRGRRTAAAGDHHRWRGAGEGCQVGVELG